MKYAIWAVACLFIWIGMWHVTNACIGELITDRGGKSFMSFVAATITTSLVWYHVIEMLKKRWR